MKYITPEELISVNKERELDRLRKTDVQTKSVLQHYQETLDKHGFEECARRMIRQLECIHQTEKRTEPVNAR